MTSATTTPATAPATALQPRRAARPDTPSVSVIIPTRNEAKNLPWVLARMPEVDEVILVDADSTDGTADVARRHYPGIKVIGQPAPGKGAALAAGFAAATGDIIVGIDADCSMDPQEIHAYVGTLRAGADLAKGSRYVAGGGSQDLSVLRNAGNKGLGILSNVLYRQSWSELCYGYFAFWADLLPDLGVTDPGALRPTGELTRKGKKKLGYGHGFEIEAVLFLRAATSGYKVVEVASFEYDRAHGTSNLNTWRDGARVLSAVLKERRTRTASAAERRARARAQLGLEAETAPAAAIPAPRSAATVEATVQANAQVTAQVTAEQRAVRSA